MDYHIAEHNFLTLCFIGLIAYCWTSYLLYEVQMSIIHFGLLALGLLVVALIVSHQAKKIIPELFHLSVRH